MVSVLAGANWFALKQELDVIEKNFIKTHGPISVERIYAPDVEAGVIMESLAGRSLFSEDRLVVVTDLSLNKPAAAKLETILDLIDESTQVVIVEGALDKRSVFYKVVKKLKSFKEFNELSPDALESWAVDFAKKSGANLSRSDARYLIERVGGHQTMMEKEIIKLGLYNGKITQETIDLLTEAIPSSTIFNLVESAFSGNVHTALKLYEEQRALRKEPQAIFGMLVWQMHLVAICAAAGNKSARDIASETGLNAYSLGKAQTIARRMGIAKVQSFLDLLKNIEITAKSQTYDLDQALRHAITRLAY